MNNLINKARNFGAAVINRVKSAVSNTISNVTTAVTIAVTTTIYRSRMAVAGNRAEGFVDTAVKILMAVVIGALVLAGLYLLFSGTILPELTRRIQEMFNYRG
jgi:hypothetical protein